MWVDLEPPRTPPTRVQAGPRPGVILQADAFQTRSSLVLIVPGTSQLRATRFPGAHEVRPDATNGLTVPTVFLPHQLRAVDRAQVRSRIGQVGPGDLAALSAAVRALLGL